LLGHPAWQSRWNRHFRSSPPRRRPARATIRILIVDDEDTLRESCASVLDARGLRCHGERQGPGGAGAARASSFDIVLIDWYMSDVPGKELLAVALTRTPPSAPSSPPASRPSTRASRPAARGVDYLPKPFSATQLQILVGRAAHADHHRAGADEPPRGAAAGGGQQREGPGVGIAPSFRNAIGWRAAWRPPMHPCSSPARAARARSSRPVHPLSQAGATRPLSGLDCPPARALLESEMFGHRRGDVHRPRSATNRAARDRNAAPAARRADRNVAADPSQAAARFRTASCVAWGARRHRRS